MTALYGVLGDLAAHVRHTVPVRRSGRVVQVVGTVIEADLPGVAVGELVTIDTGQGEDASHREGGSQGDDRALAGGEPQAPGGSQSGISHAEVIGFREDRALLMPLGRLDGISHGSHIQVQGRNLTVPVGDGLLGRVIDPMGQPVDDRPLSNVPFRRAVQAGAPPPMARRRITQPLATGVRALDALLTLGEGQRVAVMAGSGVGKSTLLGMIARYCVADINVVALIGERGREVREFIERDLGPEGLARSVVVVATSDASPVLQVKGLLTAMAVAEHFRDQGQKVLLMADSLTRLAMAQRQIGLAAGEPPTTRGFTPSVFTLLPRLLERAGPGVGEGSITAVCTVLVEGDDMDDPVGDTVRGILDGHIVLSRRLASHNHYPPIDVLESLSRTMSGTCSKEQLTAAGQVRDLLATWSENEDLVRLGAYKRGSDAKVDHAIQMNPAITNFLRQAVDDGTPWESCIKTLVAIAATPAAATRVPGGPARSPR